MVDDIQPGDEPTQPEAAEPKPPTRLSDAFADLPAGSNLGEAFAAATAHKEGLLRSMIPAVNTAKALSAHTAQQAASAKTLAAFAQVEALGAKAALDLERVLKGPDMAAFMAHEDRQRERHEALNQALKDAAANSPEARTARATREIADRLATSQADLTEYQRVVTQLVEQLNADAADDRARAERAEQRAEKAERRTTRAEKATWLGLVVGVLGVAAGFVTPYIH